MNDIKDPAPDELEPEPTDADTSLVIAASNILLEKNQKAYEVLA